MPSTRSPDQPVENSSRFDPTVIIDSLLAHNEFIVAERALNRKLQECTSDVDRMKNEVEELFSRATILTSVNQVGKERKVGQVYYRFQELVKEKVFGDTYFPVYTVRDIEDAFEDDEEDSIFNNKVQKDEFESKWKDIKDKINWAGEEDFDMLESLEVYKYGFREPPLTLPQLRESLGRAKEVGLFYEDNDIQKFERLFDMYEKLNTL